MIHDPPPGASDGGSALSRRAALKHVGALGAAVLGSTALTQAVSMAPALAADGRVVVTMTPTQASTFLQNLATNDRFRAALEASPRTVLARSGVIMPDDLLPAQVVLPSKERIREVIQIIASELENPSAGGIVAAFPLAFVLVLIFVFIPA